MQLGYPVRLARYAFLLGLLALLLSGATVFSLNIFTVRTEGYQTQLSGRFHRVAQAEPDELPEPAPSASPEFAPGPDSRSVNRIAARRTALMLRPMLFYLMGTGLLWALTSWRKGSA